MYAADQVIRYLLRTKGLCLEFNAEAEAPSLLLSCYSDAAFAYDRETRRNFHGHVRRLFRGPVSWKAGKQRSVVTSSTEAELVALSSTTREYLSILRLNKQLGLELEQESAMLCDNAQTRIRIFRAARSFATLISRICGRSSGPVRPP